MTTLELFILSAVFIPAGFAIYFLYKWLFGLTPKQIQKREEREALEKKVKEALNNPAINKISDIYQFVDDLEKELLNSKREKVVGFLNNYINPNITIDDDLDAIVKELCRRFRKEPRKVSQYMVQKDDEIKNLKSFP